MFPPHPRGWTETDDSPAEGIVVSPAPAGMDPAAPAAVVG